MACGCQSVLPRSESGRVKGAGRVEDTPRRVCWREAKPAASPAVAGRQQAQPWRKGLCIEGKAGLEWRDGVQAPPCGWLMRREGEGELCCR